MSAPALRAKVQYVKYVLSEQLATTDEMSEQAFYIDFKLMKEVWREASGCLPVGRFRERCEDRGYDEATMARVWKELTRNGRWVLSDDRKTIVCPWLEVGIAASGKLILAGAKGGKASGASRATGGKKSKKSRTPKAAGGGPERSLDDRSEPSAALPESRNNERADEGCNPLPDNDMHDRSTTVEPYDSVGTTSSLPSVEEEVAPTPAAPASAASHAGGAAVAVAARKFVAPVPGLGMTLRSRAEHELQEIAVPPTWREDAPLAELVALLTTAAPEVDVERALYRPCAAWQRKGGADAHRPLLAEIGACLAGDDCRTGLLSISQAPRAIALALHGALVMPEQLQPIVLRALAVSVANTIGADEPDPLRVACWLAGEFAQGKKSAASYQLACDTPRAPERLHGYATAGAR